MSQEQKQTSTSPVDCAVCGACVYGNNSNIRTCLPCKSFFRRHALLPPETLKCYQNGTCNIEATRRYFSASLPPCRACRLQKCIEIGMDQNSPRPCSATSGSSPPFKIVNKFFNNISIKASSLDENVVSSTKEMESGIDTLMNKEDLLFGRPRCSSDVSDRHHRL